MNKKIDLLVVCSLVLISVFVALEFNLKPLIGAILICLIPSLYLVIRSPKNWLKILWATLIFGVILGFIFDFVGTINNAWHEERLVIPWLILGVVPIDDILAFVLMILFVVVFYEHFIDDEKNKKLSKNLFWALIPSVLAISIIIVVFVISSPIYFRMPLVYLKLGLLEMIVPILMSIWKPKLIGKFLKIGLFFSFLWFISEVVALKTGGWIFPGQYIGTMSIFGVTFPFEEFFFWIIIFTPTIVAYYELFIDDMK